MMEVQADTDGESVMSTARTAVAIPIEMNSDNALVSGMLYKTLKGILICLVVFFVCLFVNLCIHVYSFLVNIDSTRLCFHYSYVQ